MSQFFETVGPRGLGVFCLLFGVLFLAGAVRRWEWLYPDGGNLRYRSMWRRRIALFTAGLAFVAFGALLFVYGPNYM